MRLVLLTLRLLSWLIWFGQTVTVTKSKYINNTTKSIIICPRVPLEMAHIDALRGCKHAEEEEEIHR